MITLKELNTLRIDVGAKQLLTWHDVRELFSLRREYKKIPFIAVLGSGSNVVLTRNIDGLCIQSHAQELRVVEQTEDAVCIVVDAGYNWNTLVWHTLRQGWYGLENLVHIPGTVGAAPVQNIGAYGRQLSDFCQWVEVFDWQAGKVIRYSNEQCRFSYRNSALKRKAGLNNSIIITRICLQLQKKPELVLDMSRLPADILPAAEISPLQLAKIITDVRNTKLPDVAIEPNVGSFFHNPIIAKEQLNNDLQPMVTGYTEDGKVKLSAAKLVDACGWKGYNGESGAGVSHKHALCLVNRSNATGGDILQLAERIRASVIKKFAVALVVEPAVY